MTTQSDNLHSRRVWHRYMRVFTIVVSIYNNVKKRSQIQKSIFSITVIHASFFCLVYPTQVHWEPGDHSRELMATLGQVSVHHRAQSYSYTHTHVHTLRTVFRCQSAENTHTGEETGEENWRTHKVQEEPPHPPGVRHLGCGVTISLNWN